MSIVFESFKRPKLPISIKYIRKWQLSTCPNRLACPIEPITYKELRLGLTELRPMLKLLIIVIAIYLKHCPQIKCVRAVIHKLSVRTANREEPGQTALGLLCLPRPFWPVTSVQNFRTYVFLISRGW